MAPIKATFCGTLLALFCFNSALATPDLAIMARLARPIFTPSAGTTGFGSFNSTSLFSTGTGTGFAGPTGATTTTPTTIPSPIPDLANIQRRKAPSTPSAGFGSKACHNETHHHPTGHHHGTAATTCSESVGTASFTLPSVIETALTLATPIVTPAVQRRLVHIPSGGFSSSVSSNGTLAGPTGTTGTGTGVGHATGTGASSAVSATGAVLLPTYTPAVVGRSRKAAWSWWG
ncbi:MAG: hypothetical protein HETSPECPRED_007687 [Heterodermia speciosa]|uniref:Uncharacterized protein n=1 Tax=Heterodermia speciosa TaxID=116794 RepID=A0A8H3FV85_9LECA|nr:MAG: hypothetical protein HETSPECPRED_007687 [Heterodermia speciosa]